MIYLKISNSNSFYFIISDVELQECIPITLEDYNKFNELESNGKQFVLKDVPTGNNLFDYLEEKSVPPQAPTQEERLQALEEAMLSIL